MGKPSTQVQLRLQQPGHHCPGSIRLLIPLGFKKGADPGMPEPTALDLLWR
uniref:Uncharacterized protein n=1 Tax=Sciurus vulgaris TaxID=55149 RepID=A0A8D2ASL5_SCIVU